MKSIFFAFTLLLIPFAQAKDAVVYFSCLVQEGKTEVTVKFAVKNYVSYEGKGELISYPGTNEDNGAIFVSPIQIGKRFSKMSNLNGQGGDLRINSNGDLHLFGDGDGYQFTDLVIWNDNDDSDRLEGYVRDYGSAYGDSETFKQFIKCQKSSKVL